MAAAWVGRARLWVKKPAAGGQIGFLRPFQASWGSVSLKIGFGATRSLGFRGRIGQFAGGGLVGWAPKMSGAEGQMVARRGATNKGPQTEKSVPAGLFFWDRFIFFWKLLYTPPPTTQAPKRLKKYLPLEGARFGQLLKKINWGPPC